MYVRVPRQVLSGITHEVRPEVKTEPFTFIRVLFGLDVTHTRTTTGTPEVVILTASIQAYIHT